jgi:hypothetical protein
MQQAGMLRGCRNARPEEGRGSPGDGGLKRPRQKWGCSAIDEDEEEEEEENLPTLDWFLQLRYSGMLCSVDL